MSASGSQDIPNDFFYDFDVYSDGTKKFLLSLIRILRTTVSALFLPGIILCCVGAIVHIFHLLVLTRKSMRSSSTNVLMIGIAFCDLSIMVYTVYTPVLQYIFQQKTCSTPYSYLLVAVNVWTSALREDFRRLTTWLGVSMASLRVLIIRNSMNKKFKVLSRPSFAWKSIIVLLTFSSFLSWFYNTHFDIAEIEEWIPGEHCLNFPDNHTEKQYMSMLDHDFSEQDMCAVHFYWLFDGMLKIIPAIAFPILTFLLVRELGNARTRRSRINKNQSTGSEASKNDRNTTLVTLMTVTFMLAEGPLGIVMVAQIYATNSFAFADIVFNLASILEMFAVINATTHCFICWTLSSQYQKCVRELFCCGGKRSGSVINVRSTVEKV